MALAQAHISSAWIRALPPTQPVTAAYLSVMNHGETPITVTGARVEGAGRVEMHTSREVDGLLRMEQVTALTIAPGQTLSLEPGGAHLMLLDLQAMPSPGESRQLCLLMAAGLEVCAAAQVRRTALADEHQHHPHP
jgi:hypothetical protein